MKVANVITYQPPLPFLASSTIENIKNCTSFMKSILTINLRLLFNIVHISICTLMLELL